MNDLAGFAIALAIIGFVSAVRVFLAATITYYATSLKENTDDHRR